jgi:hypothetical protein
VNADGVANCCYQAFAQACAVCSSADSKAGILSVNQDFSPTIVPKHRQLVSLQWLVQSPGPRFDSND